MCGSIVDIHSATAEIKREKKKKKKKPQGKNMMSASATQGSHKKLNLTQINCNTQYNHRKAKSNQQTTVMAVHVVHSVITVHNCCTEQT